MFHFYIGENRDIPNKAKQRHQAQRRDSCVSSPKREANPGPLGRGTVVGARREATTQKERRPDGLASARHQGLHLCPGVGGPCLLTANCPPSGAACCFPAGGRAFLWLQTFAAGRVLSVWASAIVLGECRSRRCNRHVPEDTRCGALCLRVFALRAPSLPSACQGLWPIFQPGC